MILPVRDIRLSPIEVLIFSLITVYSFIYSTLIFSTTINWDEFHFLSDVYQFSFERPMPVLQTFYIYFFQWLLWVPGNEIDQILVARSVSASLFFASLTMIYVITRCYFSRIISLLIILTALTFNDSIRHGFSFRYDLLCLFFSIVALFLLIKTRTLTGWALAGFVFSINLLISIKTVFFLPTTVLILMSQCKELQNRPKAIKLTTTFLISTVAAFAILFFLHHEAVTKTPTQEFTTSVGVIAQQLDSMGNAMLREPGFLPRIETIRRAIDENPIHTFLIAVGILIALGELFNHSTRLRSIVLIAFTLPLFSLLIYRNAFPYFLVYIIPPALVITGLTVERLIAMEFPNRTKATTIIALVLAIALPVLSANLIFERVKDGISHQKNVIAVIHEIFPNPVSYIDAHQMVSSFPSHGLFLSTLGMKNYRQSGRPIMRRLLEHNQPQFLLANKPALQIGKPYRDSGIGSLSKEDYTILSENFIHHWGPIFVPGKEFQIDEFHSEISFEILIQGLYSVETENAVRLNGRLLDPGSVLWLSIGLHHLEATPGLVRLRWGDRLKRPETPFIRKPLYIPL